MLHLKTKQKRKDEEKKILIFSNNRLSPRSDTGQSITQLVSLSFFFLSVTLHFVANHPSHYSFLLHCPSRPPSLPPTIKVMFNRLQKGLDVNEATCDTSGPCYSLRSHSHLKLLRHKPKDEWVSVKPPTLSL